MYCNSDWYLFNVLVWFKCAFKTAIDCYKATSHASGATIDRTLNYVFKLGTGFVFSFLEKTNNSTAVQKSSRFRILYVSVLGTKILNSRCCYYKHVRVSLAAVCSNRLEVYRLQNLVEAVKVKYTKRKIIKDYINIDRFSKLPNLTSWSDKSESLSVKPSSKSAILFFFFIRVEVWFESHGNPLTGSSIFCLYRSFLRFHPRRRRINWLAMDQFYDVFKFYAGQFANIPMFPVLQCAHYTIMCLKLRMEAGKLVQIYTLRSAIDIFNKLSLLGL